MGGDGASPREEGQGLALRVTVWRRNRRGIRKLEVWIRKAGKGMENELYTIIWIIKESEIENITKRIKR